MNNLYSYYADCGRNGSLKGLFIATPDEVSNAIGKYAYFGEVLGKHSEVEGTIDQDEITLISDDQEKIAWLESILGKTVSGLNPLNYIRDEE